MSDKWNAPPLAGIADPEYQAKIDASVLPPDAANPLDREARAVAAEQRRIIKLLKAVRFKENQ
jgi:hypothetical protein